MKKKKKLEEEYLKNKSSEISTEIEKISKEKKELE